MPCILDIVYIRGALTTFATLCLDRAPPPHRLLPYTPKVRGRARRAVERSAEKRDRRQPYWHWTTTKSRAACIAGRAAGPRHGSCSAGGGGRRGLFMRTNARRGAASAGARLRLLRGDKLAADQKVDQRRVHPAALGSSADAWRCSRSATAKGARSDVWRRDRRPRRAAAGRRRRLQDAAPVGRDSRQGRPQTSAASLTSGSGGRRTLVGRRAGRSTERRRRLPTR